MNHKTREQIDLDEKFEINNIKEIIHDSEDHYFYLLANKYQGRLGVFLVRFQDEDPDDKKYLLRWKNKLDIADANVDIIRIEGCRYKELLISYKTIYMNTYTV